jgi:hypothetical protein
MYPLSLSTDPADTERQNLCGLARLARHDGTRRLASRQHHALALGIGDRNHGGGHNDAGYAISLMGWGHCLIA